MAPSQPLEHSIETIQIEHIGTDSAGREECHSLDEGEKNVSELVTTLGQSQGRISNHLACLRWCGYVDSRREGKFVYYHVADPRIRQLLELARAVMADHAAAILSCTRI